MGAKSRDKGAAFEREMAQALFDRLGITFKRDLDQYRESKRGDLIPGDPAFPFLIECKRYADGTTCKPAFQIQAKTAAAAVRKRPAVIYRYDRQNARVSVPLSAFCDKWPSDEWADISLDGFCFLAREIMAEPFGWVPNDYTELHTRFVGSEDHSND